MKLLSDTNRVPIPLFIILCEFLSVETHVTVGVTCHIKEIFPLFIQMGKLAGE